MNKKVINVVDINPSISIITLNMNGLNIPIKRQTGGKKERRNSLAVQRWLHASAAGSPRSVSNWGTKIPQAAWLGQKKKGTDWQWIKKNNNQLYVVYKKPTLKI